MTDIIYHHRPPQPPASSAPYFFKIIIYLTLLFTAIFIYISTAHAGALMDRLREHRAEKKSEASAQPEGEEHSIFGRTFKGTISTQGVTQKLDIPYGTHDKHKLDVYIPAGAHNAPMIVMVHGGGWRTGDKTMTGVITNKGNHYTAKGYVFISVNNRLVPDADALAQAEDIANALVFIQKNAATWGGDASKLVTMGHSAGAHLVGLLAAMPSKVTERGGQKWSGTVALDSGAVDVEGIMNKSHRSIYDNAFGADPALWRAASPLVQTNVNSVPMLLVCSSKRKDSCPANQAVVDKATSLGVKASLLPEALSHGQINDKLGEDSEYTKTVDDFILSVTQQR